jgi:hypothetical protein
MLGCAFRSRKTVRRKAFYNRASIYCILPKNDLAVAFYVHLCKCKHTIYITDKETIPITPL